MRDHYQPWQFEGNSVSVPTGTVPRVGYGAAGDGTKHETVRATLDKRINECEGELERLKTLRERLAGALDCSMLDLSDLLRR